MNKRIFAVMVAAFTALSLAAAPASASGNCQPPRPDGEGQGPSERCWVKDFRGADQGSQVTVNFTNDSAVAVDVVVLGQRNGHSHQPQTLYGAQLAPFSQSSVSVTVPDPPRGNRPFLIIGKIEKCNGLTAVDVI